MNELLLALVPSAGASLLTWFLARKKNNAEAETVELENVSKAISIWRESAEDLVRKCAALTEEIAKLREENISLKYEIAALKSQMDHLTLKQS